MQTWKGKVYCFVILEVTMVIDDEKGFFHQDQNIQLQLYRTELMWIAPSTSRHSQIKVSPILHFVIFLSNGWLFFNETMEYNFKTILMLT